MQEELTQTSIPKQPPSDVLIVSDEDTPRCETSFAQSTQINLPISEEATGAGPTVTGTSEGVPGGEPSINGPTAEEMVESDFVEKENDTNFGAVASVGVQLNTQYLGALVTSVSIRLDGAFSTSESSQHDNVGTIYY
jgi:hypothetical protein|uniref:Uncharacterized protein n=1 Tax=Attheya septentrionalis TaxID=420275 RepID=A0A7S2UQL8_9STRA|mmetsp:Transcript_6547/g.11718  ORF Transcript_6547/g.11718 Transcript_6547/m.11718 type:complete len:137 (+) Transcript_6547:150-560(+)